MRLAGWGALLMAAAGLVALSRGEDAAGRAPARSGPPAGPTPLHTDFRGSGSCSATACHGSITPADPALSAVLRNEHTTWLSDDDHSRAYQALFEPRSERIVRNLAADPGRVLPAHRDERCLACHSTPRPFAERPATTWMDADGVGCESCHGASGRWLGPHTTIGWRDLSVPQKTALGMRNTRDLASRARLCAGCHVGDGGSDDVPTRDVNHDLIAAGHPRLNFELSAYLDNMPPHWIEKGVNGDTGTGNPFRRAADFPARAWAIGRLAASEAALKLLQWRAAQAHQREAPWPEFAELGCFSCHHDLRDQAWRRAPRPPGTLAGSPRWGSWTLPQIDDLLAEIADRPGREDLEKSLHKVAGLMERPVPDPTAVQRTAADAAIAAGRCLDAIATHRLGDPDVARLIGRIDRREGRDLASRWDDAAHRYLALVALCQSWVDLAPGRKADQDGLKRRLEEFRGRLAFPAGLDSPKEFDPGRLPAGR